MIYVIIGIVLALIIICIAIYNTMLTKRNKLKNAYASLDVMLKKRYDLIPNIVSCVKQYATYEQETLTKVIGLRQKANECKNSKDLEDVDGEYNSFMTQVGLLREAYPDLKADKNYLNLQKVLIEMEEQISAARRTYNAHVERFNTYISLIPLNIFAAMYGFKKYEYFKINDTEANSIKVEL